MHPAPSVILFTVLSGLGFGFLFMLDAGFVRPGGIAALLAFALAYGLATAGLIASTFHLGNPQRALKAFGQWRTSWLSREGWASLAALSASAPVAYSAVFAPHDQGFAGTTLGFAAAGLCAATVLCTAMIYTQLKTVPRWNHWGTPLSFFAFAASGGAILALGGWVAALLCLATGGVMELHWRLGDQRFATKGSNLNSATGLEGDIRVFAPAHTAGNYVMREMVHHVGRKHARKLRLIALALTAALPALILIALPQGLLIIALAALSHTAGALAQRWLFFAQAEHVVSHYYGRT